MSDIDTYSESALNSLDSHLRNLEDFLHHTAWLQVNAEEDDTLTRSTLDLLKIAKGKLEADIMAIEKHLDIVFHRRSYDHNSLDRLGEIVSVDIKPARQPGLKARDAVAI